MLRINAAYLVPVVLEHRLQFVLDLVEVVDLIRLSDVDPTSSNRTSQRFVWCEAKLICEKRWSSPGSALISLAVRCVWFLLKACPYVTVEPVLLRLAILSQYVN